jgi:hypothetical protein
MKTQHQPACQMTTSAVRIPGERSLLVAVIEQAVCDYFILMRRKAIRFGKLTGKVGEGRQKSKSKKTGEYYIAHTVNGMTAKEMNELIDFLKHNAQRFADAAELDMDISSLFDKVISLERSDRFRKSTKYLDMVENDNLEFTSDVGDQNNATT